jgi:hypothetical protein
MLKYYKDVSCMQFIQYFINNLFLIKIRAAFIHLPFVRGDSSRNNEGSGLGFSIARSLTELQKSDLEIAVDGDLFKVKISFERIYD